MTTIAFTDLPFILQLIIAGVALLFAALAVLPLFLAASHIPQDVEAGPKTCTSATARGITPSIANAASH